MTEEHMRLSRKPGLVVTGIVVTAMSAMSIYAWTRLHEGAQIPVHWGTNGEADRYGSARGILVLRPIIALVIGLVFAAIPFLEPRRLNFANSRKAYLAFWVGILVWLTGVHAATVLQALGRSVNVAFFVASGVGLLLIVIGNFLGKLRSNFFIGIRTPWTLSSERSWNKTHRLGGKLFILMGCLMLLRPWLPAAEPWTIFVVVLPLVALGLLLLVYSFVVWRNDPNKQKLGRQ
jgi:uncharacterized membrane protein